MNIPTFAKLRHDPEQLAGKILQDLRTVIEDLQQARANHPELWAQLIRDADDIEDCADKLNDVSCEICMAADPSMAA